MESIYLDNSATTKPLESVIDEMKKVLSSDYGNPSSLHGMGVIAEKHIKKSRESTANILKVSPSEIFFTSGGTEANNFAIRGIALQNQGRGKHLITSEVEHSSVLACFKRLEEEGFKVSYIPVDADGIIKLEVLKKELRNDTVLISIMHVNNEMGAVQPIEKIKEIINKSEKPPFFHLDAVQSVGKIPVFPREKGIDLMSISAHKFHGPKGTGALYIRKGVNIKSILLGGEQEANLRAGTENVPGIVGMGKACEEININLENNSRYLKKIKNAFIEIIKQDGKIHINGSLDKNAPHIINLYFEGIDKSEVLIHMLEEHGIYVSSGSACHSRRPDPSHVLKAMGLSADRINGSIRISFSILNTEEDVIKAAEIIKEAAKEFRDFSLL
jgi:cysteine desulfurase